MEAVLCYFWIFILGSYFGAFIETFWCVVRYKKLENRRGVIYEPMIPIYGFSAIFIVLVNRLFQLDTWYEIFLSGFIVSSIIEFVSHFLQEKLLSTVSWDYSDFPFNFGGRINLIYSILFGIVSFAMYKLFLLPFFEFFMALDMNVFVMILSIFMILFFAYDCCISFLAL